MRWILEENSQAVLQAVDVQLICIARHLVGFLLLDCLAHWKQTQTLNWLSQSTKFERYGTVLDMNANHELTARIAKMFAVLNLCHVSSENVPKQNEQNSVWVQHFFQIINVTNCSSDFEGIANEIEATFAVLQGQQPRHSNPNPCCTSRLPATNLLTGEEDMNAWLKEISW